MFVLKNDYGFDDLVVESLELVKMEVVGDKLFVEFGWIGGMLKIWDGEVLMYFEVIGSGLGGYYLVIVEIVGNMVIL